MGEAEQPGMYPVRGMPAGMSEDGAYKAEPPGQVQMNLIEAAAGFYSRAVLFILPVSD